MVVEAPIADNQQPLVEISIEDVLLSFSGIAKYFDVNCGTVRRWNDRGIAGHKMPSLLRGGRRVTTLAAVESWMRHVTAIRDGQPSPTTTSAAHKRSIRQATETLRAAGI